MAKVTKPTEEAKISSSPVASGTESIEKTQSIKETKAGKHEKGMLQVVELSLIHI